MEKKDKEDAAGGSPAANGRIPPIKLKIPKQAEEEEAKSHYCKECNKSFSSGKALGGHMSSAHVQANKDYSSKKLSSSSKRKSPASYSGSPNSTCDLCGKKFHSKKSLFGHMRCHPERDWRGMEPPPPDPRIDSADSDADADASSEDDDVDGLSGSRHEQGFNLTRWPTSKRGRGPVTSAAAASGGDSGSEKEPMAAGMQLLKMLNGAESRKEENDPKSPRMNGNGNGKGKGKGKGKEKDDEDLEIDPKDELVIAAIQVLADGRRGRGRGRGRGSDEKRELFQCSECPRFFSTHQALGGHRSSHNKFKMSVVNTASRPTTNPNPNPDTPPKRKEKEKLKKRETMEASASEVAAAFTIDLNVIPPEAEAEAEAEEDKDNYII